jgi:hypothetical protein
MRSFSVSLLVVLVIAILGMFMPAMAEAVDCPHVISTHRVVSASHADGVTTLVYEVILVNVGRGDLIDQSGPEAAMYLPPRATVDLGSLSPQVGLTVVSEDGYDTAILWDLSLVARDATSSSVTVTVPDKPIQDGAPTQQGDSDWQSDLFLYVGASCNNGMAP